MTALEDAWLALATRAQQQVTATAAAYEAGRMSTDRFTESAALAVYVANAHAMAFADTAVAAWKLATIGVPTATLGLLPSQDEQERLIRAFATIAAHTQAMSLTDRSARVAQSEPLRAGRSAYQEALRARGVEQWRRVVMPDACDQCAPLAEKVYPMEEPFRDHVNCRCSLAPVTPVGWGDRQRATQHRLISTIETPTAQIRFSAGLRIRSAA
jgi:hypothetical protein